MKAESFHFHCIAFPNFAPRTVHHLNQHALMLLNPGGKY